MAQSKFTLSRATDFLFAEGEYKYAWLDWWHRPVVIISGIAGIVLSFFVMIGLLKLLDLLAMDGFLISLVCRLILAAGIGLMLLFWAVLFAAVFYWRK